MGHADIEGSGTTVGIDRRNSSGLTSNHAQVLTPKSCGLGIDKARTGIVGLDEILNGGLPRARPTLLCGGPGCGKTLLAMEFICRGALQFGEPGDNIAFEDPLCQERCHL